jgi:hypothetical protein
MTLKVKKATGIGAEHDVTNGGNGAIAASIPYIVQVELTGVADILFHRWNSEGIEAKGKAAKGSAAKKTDDVESYTYRDDIGDLCLPGEYVRQSMIHAAKYRQDPRSPRKSAMDLYKAGIVSLTPLASFGVPAWGWKVTMDFMINLPEYIPESDFHDVLVNAGRLVGVGDFRPSYGRFGVTSIEVQG